MLRSLARLLAVVLAALFVCSTVAVVFLRPAGARLLESQTYKDVVRTERIGERFPDLSADLIGRAATGSKNAERASTAVSKRGRKRARIFL